MADWSPSLTGLVKLQIEYRYAHPPQARPSSRLPPLTRIFLPVLTALAYKGGSDYLDLLFSHFDVPRLGHVDMDFVYSPTFAFSKLFPVHRLHVTVRGIRSSAYVRSGSFRTYQRLALFTKRDYQWRHVAQAVDELGTRRLAIRVSRTGPSSVRSTTRHLWTLQLLPAEGWTYVILAYLNRERPMGGVFTPFLCCGEFVSPQEHCESVAPVLQKLGAGESARKARDVLPALQTISVEGLDPSKSKPVREAIGKFVAARKLSNHPVAVHRWVGN